MVDCKKKKKRKDGENVISIMMLGAHCPECKDCVDVIKCVFFFPCSLKLLFSHFYLFTMSHWMAVLALLHADKRNIYDCSYRWAFFHYCVISYCFADVEVTVRYSFLSKQLLMLWRWLNWKLPHCRRILFPDIRNTATFSLPTFTWLILTAVHGAAWCHLQALPHCARPCTSMIRDECGAM